MKITGLLAALTLTAAVLGNAPPATSATGAGSAVATTAYSGVVSFPTSLTGTTYSMSHPDSSTLECQNDVTNVTFSGPDDVWGNGKPDDWETGCAGAYYAATQEREMLATWLGRDGMDGAGGWVPIRVGLDEVNAYYDGRQVHIGHTQSGGWMSSIDFVAHELGHGIDAHTPGGRSGGGTKEWIADVFGTATEHFADNPVDRPDYLIGEQVSPFGTGAIRNMYKPSALGSPDCFDEETLATLSEHHAAGPGNHWFYLLAEGSSPTNGQPASPTCNGARIAGVGIKASTQIVYGAMLRKSSDSSYPKYRTWTLAAAASLDPSCALYNQARRSWNAVEVPRQTDEPTCTPGATPVPVTVAATADRTGSVGAPVAPFTLSASGGTAPYSWSAAGLPPGLVIGSTTGTVSGTPTAAGSYAVTVTASTSAGQASTSFVVTVSGCAGQLLGNPGFETGTAAPWTAPRGVVDSSSKPAARTGAWKAWLNGYGMAHTDKLSQTVTVPSGCRATLSFYLLVDTDEPTTTSKYDTLTVQVGTKKLAFSNLDGATAGYRLRTLDVSAYAGQTVTVSFTGVEDSSSQTSFVVDDVAVTLG